MFQNQNKMPLMLITKSFVLLVESAILLTMDMLLPKEVRSRSKRAFLLRMLVMHLRMPREIESYQAARRTGPTKTHFDYLYYLKLVIWSLHFALFLTLE
jgi:hypothetical protein